MFPEEWERLGGEKNPKGKPKDKTLLKLRGDSKSVSFGLFYGKSNIGLGDTLGIPSTTKDLIEKYPEEYKEYMNEYEDLYVEFIDFTNLGRDTQRSKLDFIKREHAEKRFLGEVVTADDLITRFFTVFPNIKRTLAECANTGVNTRRIRTLDPIGRVRFFPKAMHVPEEVGGKEEMNNGEEGSIRRKSQNTPIQGSAASMTKYAMCILNKYIEDNDLDHKIKFCLPIHDELIYIAREDFAEEGLKLVIDKMEEAGKFILGSGLLKAEGAISDHWEK